MCFFTSHECIRCPTSGQTHMPIHCKPTVFLIQPAKVSMASIWMNFIGVITRKSEVFQYRICLDTLASMATAQGLYQSLGFVPIKPYVSILSLARNSWRTTSNIEEQIKWAG